MIPLFVSYLVAQVYHTTLVFSFGIVWFKLAAFFGAKASDSRQVDSLASPFGFCSNVVHLAYGIDVPAFFVGQVVPFLLHCGLSFGGAKELLSADLSRHEGVKQRCAMRVDLVSMLLVVHSHWHSWDASLLDSFAIAFLGLTQLFRLGV